jgi:Ca-activated chloride channel family protein
MENTITLKTLSDNLYFLKDRKELYLYIDLKAGKAPVKTERTPLNLALVLDRSGSMGGDKIKYSRQACQFVVDNLEPNDYLSLVIYDDQIEVLSASAQVKDKNKLRKLIEDVFERGWTNLSGGMLEGFAQVKNSFSKNFVNRVLLLSDGLANQGITDEKVLNQLAKQKNSEEGMTLSTFGVGADFNEVLMTNLAEYGSGNYYFIDSPDKIPTIFAQELKGLLSVVAQNTMLKVKFPDNALSFVKAFGYNANVQGNEISFDLKDVFSEEQKSVLLKFNVNQAADAEITFETSLGYDDAFSFQRVNISAKNEVKFTNDKDLFERSFDKDVLQNIVLFENNQKMEEAMQEVDKGDIVKAKKVLMEIKAEMSIQMKDLPGSLELEKQLSNIDAYEQQLEHADEMSNEDMKIMQKTSRSMNYSIRKKK